MDFWKRLQLPRILWVILGFGFFIRIIAVSYGLPYHLYGDEESVIYTAFRMLEVRTLIPALHWESFKGLSYYPPALSYIHLLFFLPAIAVRYALLGMPAIAVFKDDLILHLSLFFLIARTLGVCFSVGSIFLVYKIGRLLFPKQPSAALWSAFFLAGSFLDASVAPTGRHFVPSLFFGLCGMYYGLRVAHETVYRRLAIIAGCLFGITFGINYIVFYLPFVCLYIVFMQRHDWAGMRDRLLFLLAPFALLALGFVLVHPQPFFEQVVYHDNAEYGTKKTLLGSLGYYLLVWWHYEPVVFICSLLGWAIMWWKDRKLWWLFGILVSSIACIMYAVLWNIPRYLVPSVPIVSLVGGYAAAHIVSQCRSIGYLFFGITALYYVVVYGQYSAIMLRNDTRLTAERWVRNQLGHEQLIMASDRLRLPAHAAASNLVASINPHALRSTDRAILALPDAEQKISLFSAYNISFVGNDRERWGVLDAIFALPGKKYFVVDSYVQVIGPFQILAKQGVLVKRFDGGDSQDKTQTLFIGGEEKELHEMLVKKLLRLRQFGPVVSIYEYGDQFRPLHQL